MNKIEGLKRFIIVEAHETVDAIMELQRLAEIGNAAEKAFSQAACLEIFEPEYAEIHNVDQLVEWAKGRKE